jgi:hypothetical protein
MTSQFSPPPVRAHCLWCSDDDRRRAAVSEPVGGGRRVRLAVPRLFPAGSTSRMCCHGISRRHDAVCVVCIATEVGGTHGVSSFCVSLPVFQPRFLCAAQSFGLPYDLLIWHCLVVWLSGCLVVWSSGCLVARQHGTECGADLVVCGGSRHRRCVGCPSRPTVPGKGRHHSGCHFS